MSVLDRIPIRRVSILTVLLFVALAYVAAEPSTQRIVPSRRALSDLDQRLSSGFGGQHHHFGWTGQPAQQSPSRTRRQIVTALPLLVDGEETPELVPDQLAYRHFIVATAVAAVPGPDDLARREFMLTRAGLSSAQRRAFAVVLSGVRDQLNRMGREPNDGQTKGLSDDARARRNQILDDARERIEAQLDADAVARIQAYVQAHVKTHIKIFGQMPPAAH